MSRNQYGVLLVVAVVAGLLSGVVSSYVMVGWLIAAQKLPPPIGEQASHTAKVIRAERFELVGKDSKTRAVLGEGVLPFSKEDSSRTEEKREEREEERPPGLFFFDEEGKTRGAFVMRDVGGMGLILRDPPGSFSTLYPGVLLISDGGNSATLFGGSGPTGPSLDLSAPGRNAHLAAGITGGITETPSLVLSASDGRFASLNTGISGGPSVTLNGAYGNDRPEEGAWLEVGPEGSSLHLYDRGGGSATLDMGLDKSPSLRLIDQARKLRAGLGSAELEDPRTGAKEKRAVSSLVLCDKDGKVIWRAP